MAGMLGVKSDNRVHLIHVGPDSRDAAPDPAQEIPPGPGKSLPRHKLSLQVSRDEGVNWSSRIVLEPGISGYNDLALHPDGSILCLFESGYTDAAGQEQRGQLSLLRMSVRAVLDATREK